MFITYKQLLSMKELNRAEIAGGKAGLYRIICWYSIAEIVSYKEESYEDKLVFVSGIGLTNYKQELLNIIRYVIKKGAAGIVLEIGPFIHDVPDEIQKFADENAFPVLALPYDIKVSNVTYAMAKILSMQTNYYQGMRKVMDELRTQTVTNELMEKAFYYGYKSREAYYGIIVEEDDHLLATQDGVKDKLLLSFFAVFGRLDYKDIFWSEENGCLMFIVAWRNSGNLKQEISKYMTLLEKDWHSKYYKWSLSIGVGSVFHDIKDAALSLEQAKKALYMIRQCHKRHEIRIFEDTGIYRLFFEYNDSSELENIYHSVLGDLLEYDKKNDAELTKTLEVFLNCNCNISLTSETMNVHRNTIKYRVKRIQEILNLDIASNNQCFNLRLAFKIKKFLRI
ncbi:MAG: helix-turn-helix domain-containing protein [Clostridia bacterium]|jgi:sugar diacid utilization regulator|nr:helix-turn-helix domain-containing protein [Clostridia bacterium]MCI2000652.1 helix-turn-helix domain-containing protein [Clostridia bacterium]MCI2015275.1 helix-turn-helix domain-containing protein [Clostridia bacterium]